jgi:ABC-type methionine transport system ATPase subunit
MLEVAKNHRTALMLITHNMETVQRIADVVVQVGKGH